MTPELRIRDHRPGLRTLVKLEDVLAALELHRPGVRDGPWRAERAYGLGAFVTEVETALESAEHVPVSWSRLIEALGAGDNFFDVTLSLEGELQLGTVDSTWHFVRGPRALLDQVARSFSDVEFVGEEA